MSASNWKHTLLVFRGTAGQVQDLLNEKAAQGWETVSVTWGNDHNDFLITLRRDMREPRS